MNTRQTIVLVSRTWYEIASEFLYSSLLVGTDTDSRSFVSPTFRLRQNKPARWVKRVTIARFPCSNDQWNRIQHSISLLNNLRIYVICHGTRRWLGRNPPPARITTLVLDTLPIDDVYQVLSNLLELKVLLIGGIRRCSATRADTPVTFPNLHTLGITFTSQNLSNWHEIIVALSVRILHAPFHTPFVALRPYLSTIHTLDISNLESYHEANIQDLPVPPRITTLILWMRSMPVDWVNQLAFLDLSQVTSLELRLDSVVQFTELSSGWESFSFVFGLESLLRLLADARLTPALRRVELDVSVNTLCSLTESAREGLCVRVAKVEEQRTIEVYAYKRVSVNDHARWIRFGEMVASQPVFEFGSAKVGTTRTDGTRLRRGRVDQTSPGGREWWDELCMGQYVCPA